MTRKELDINHQLEPCRIHIVGVNKFFKKTSKSPCSPRTQNKVSDADRVVLTQWSRAQLLFWSQLDLKLPFLGQSGTGAKVLFLSYFYLNLNL